MKKNNQFANGEITIIGAGTIVEGLLKTTASTRIDGTVNGDISSDGVIVVAGEGVVNGNIHAVDVKVNGTVKGNVITSGKTELLSNGKLIGDIHTGSLSIDENAIFQGCCRMNDVEAEEDNIVKTKTETKIKTEENSVEKNEEE